MRVRALKTFNNKDYGLIRTGMVITATDEQARKWKRNGLVAEYHGAAVADEPQPDNRAAHDAAPQTSEESLGNDESEESVDNSSSSSAVGRRRGGAVKTSALQRQGRRSRKNS